MITCPVCSWNNPDYETECSFCGFPELGYLYDIEDAVIQACKAVWRKQAIQLINAKKEHLDKINELAELQEEYDSLSEDYDELDEMYEELKEAYEKLERELKVLANSYAENILREHNHPVSNTSHNAILASQPMSDSFDERDFYMDGDTLREYRGMEERIDVPKNVKKIRRAFTNNQNITYVFLHDGISDVSNMAFAGCTNLKLVILPSFIKKIQPALFAGCRSLENIVIPPFVESIGARAFERCENLLSLDIPASVRQIGDYAFIYCVNLEQVYLTANIQDIGINVFAGCEKVTIYAPKGSYAEWYASRMNIPFMSI